MKDELRKLAHFGFWLGVGFLLFSLVSCAAVGEAGKDLKEASRWLPPPWGVITDVLGTAAVIFAGHKTVRHVRKRAEARKAQGHLSS